MNVSLVFTRIFFVILSIFFMTTYMVSGPGMHPFQDTVLGVVIGLAFGALLMGFDILFRRFNLRSFNIIVIGLFIGYLMGRALLLVFGEVVTLGNLEQDISPETLEIIKIGIFLFATYLGTLMTLRAADELYISIPFVRFASQGHKKKDLLVDMSAIFDPRLYDLCISGIVDNELIVPQFLLKELHAQVEAIDETISFKARKGLENIKRLQSIETLGLRFHKTDFPEVRDIQGKTIRLARLLESNLLTADTQKANSPDSDNIRFINLNTLSMALKPMMQAGETIRIKIQRIGKEPRQGVGYLEDGTMVVVNGGGNHLGETIEARVLSVKHTTSGRMIFCNAIDAEGVEHLEEGFHDERS